MSSVAFAPRDGYSRPDQGPVGGDGTWYFASFLVAAIAGFITFAAWDHVDGQIHTAMVAIVALCVLPFAFLLYRTIQVLQKIGRAELTTPYESLALGLPVTAVYTRPLKADVTVESVEATLQLVEKVTRGSGKNKKTFTAVAREEPITLVTRPSPNQLRIDVPIRIPESGPPTAVFDDVELRWWVRMRLRMRGCPHTRSSFEINVLPAVVKR